ncbi:MAG TPA: ammonia-forming cytochrome c nitrite reductase subunit c552, partial [Tepidisphaeraceae bacterium]|nr:ammonia-forming cytochrome c nitrite reductase subunit c552 [Tepidisphaeraceae bacterium]
MSQQAASGGSDRPHQPSDRHRGRWVLGFGIIVVVCAAIVFALAGLLMSIFEHKQEAKNPWVRLVEVDENTSDPAQWGKNWAREFDAYRRTVDITRTRFGGSEAFPQQKAKEFPWLTPMFQGYAFAIDYRERRGHAYMLADQEMTRRVTEKPQPGACLHCHASVVPTWRRIGAAALGRPFAEKTYDFDWPSVMKGFELLSAMTYEQA